MEFKWEYGGTVVYVTGAGSTLTTASSTASVLSVESFGQTIIEVDPGYHPHDHCFPFHECPPGAFYL